MKRRMKWLVPVCLLLALVLAVAGCSQGQSERPGPVEDVQKIYWNVDGEPYRSQEATRFLSDDGYYYMTFSCAGEQMRVPVADRMLVAAIDALEVMGLEFDQEGVVVGYRRVEDFTDGIIANKYYVTSVEGNKVVCNSSVSLNGYDVSFEITENTGVWDVGTVGITCGIAGAIHQNDRIIAIRDYDGSVRDVYVIPYTAPDDIYWNADRKYDSTSKSSTREMDSTGTYTFLLALNGEQVTVRTRDYEIANAMDTMAAKCFGLEFDENGYVSKVIHAGTAAGGGSCASWHHIKLLQGNHIETFKMGSAATFSGTLAEDVKVFDVSGMGDFIGQPTQLQVGDQVHCLRDSMGRVCVAFVVSRQADSEIYWNVDRKWDATNQVSTRTPDRNGWYHITVAVLGKQITVKTRDKAIVDSIDGRAAKCFGLKLNGDVIEKFYTPNAVSGGGTFASWYDIIEMDGKTITVKKASTGDVRVGKLTDDCQIYNVSANGTLVGEVTQLQLGDRIHALKDLDGNVVVAFVVTRFENLPVYYNLNRKWDATKKATTRQPDADGYYVFEMACNGKLVTVKTKSKSIANNIDSQVARCVAMNVKNGIVYKAIHPSSTTACKGGPTSSYTYVTSLGKYSFKTQKLENGKITKTYDETIASNCKVYNVSENVISHAGEQTTLMKGDYVHCLKNGDNQVCLIYVLTRFEDLGVYYNLDRKWDDQTLSTKRTPDADGLYSFRMAHKGQEVTVRTASLEVANAIDSQVAKVLGIGFDSKGLAVKAIHAKGTEACKGGIGVSYATVTKIEGNRVTTNKDGVDTTFTISKDPNVFNVSKDYEKNQGERTKLRVGDFIHCLKDAQGNTDHIYIMSRVAVIAQVEHTCQHVKEDVTWYAWDGKSAMGVSGYYALTQDAVLSGTITIPKGAEITICLNGHTVTGDSRFFKVYGTLNICDHKDAQGNYLGKLSSSYSETLNEEGKVETKAYAALAYLYNADASSVLNIYGGNFEHTGSLTSGGLVYIANKADKEKNTATFNLYDGVLSGGKATSGGAVFVSNLGRFVMHGGTISGCSADKGGAVHMNTQKGTVTISGGTVTGCTSKQTGAAVQLDNGLMTITGGTITGNTATGSGGGISLDGGQLVMTGGKLDSNTGNEGGNLRITRYASVILGGEAQVINGNASNGGNITMFGKLTVKENAAITGGKVTGLGSAISVFSNYADSRVELNMLGGTIDGSIRLDSNQAEYVAVNLLGGTVDTVSFNYNAKAVVEPQLFVGGNVQVKNITLAKGKTVLIHEKGLQEAAIGIAMADMSDPFTTIRLETDVACFHAVDESLYKVGNQQGALYLVSALPEHIHCVCGGHVTNVGDHAQCDGTVQWTAWDGTTALADGAHYYLYDPDGDGKITVSAQNNIEANAKVSICLNGVTLESDSARIFQLYGGPETTALSICDCHEESQWGGLTSTGTGVAPLIHSYTNNRGSVRIDIYGGNYRSVEDAPNAPDQAGLIRLGNTGTAAAGAEYPGVMNLYDGNLYNGSGKDGGNLLISAGCTFNMYGGSITGGYASVNGGNVYAYESAAIYLTGDVQITGAASGGNLYLSKTSTLTLGDLAETASIGISMANPGQFTTVTDANDTACFVSDNDDYQVKNSGGKLFLLSGHVHCVCVGNGVEGHSCEETTQWTAWDQTNSLPTASGYYYLTQDVTLSATVELKGKPDIKLCLNGHTVTGSGSKRVFLLRDADLHITDCQGSGVITNQAPDTLTGSIIYQYNGSSSYNYSNSVSLYAGTLTMTGKAKSGGVVYLGNQNNADWVATFNLYGGAITGGQTLKEGGNVAITNHSVFNMYGGTVSGGNAGTNGGNICAVSGQCNLYGGTITGGTAQKTGNDVYVSQSGSITLGGTAKIGQLYLGSGLKIILSTVKPLTGDASIGVTKTAPETIAQGVTDREIAKYFTSVNTAWEILLEDDTLKLAEKS